MRSLKIIATLSLWLVLTTFAFGQQVGTHGITGECRPPHPGDLIDDEEPTDDPAKLTFVCLLKQPDGKVIRFLRDIPVAKWPKLWDKPGNRQLYYIGGTSVEGFYEVATHPRAGDPVLHDGRAPINGGGNPVLFKQWHEERLGLIKK